jgi:hypothetical protein
MPHSTARPRLPQASDPIRSSIEALAVIALAIHRPLEPETIGFFLDEAGRSNTITVVSGTTDPDSVLTIAECLAVAGGRSPTLCGVVLATVRPGSASATLPGDLDRWMQAGEITESHGIELVEWFIIGPTGVECPRQLLGEAERW